MPFDAIVAAACGVEYVGNQLALYIAILKWFNMVRTHTGCWPWGSPLKNDFVQCARCLRRGELHAAVLA